VPDRLVGIGTVPMQDGHEAARELERGVRQLGSKGVEVLTNVGGANCPMKPLRRSGPRPRARSPSCRASQRVHRRQASFTISFQQYRGNPLETALALHYLIFDGVLERHPNLKILAVQVADIWVATPGESTCLGGAERLPCQPAAATDALSESEKIYVDSVVFTPHQLEALVKVFGADHVLMGTDYPFDMGEFDPIGHIAWVDQFDEATIAAIAGGNANRVLGI
jgi:aminocarboxymuconate-semialdehyde decarboxylase